MTGAELQSKLNNIANVLDTLGGQAPAQPIDLEALLAAAEQFLQDGSGPKYAAKCRALAGHTLVCDLIARHLG